MEIKIDHDDYHFILYIFDKEMFRYKNGTFSVFTEVLETVINLLKNLGFRVKVYTLY